MPNISFSVYVASPKVEKKNENRVAKYKREHAHKETLSGTTCELGNEQIRYSTINSGGDEYPHKKRGLVCCVGKTTQASKSSCEKVYEEEDGIYHRTTEYEKETVKKSFHEEARTMSKTPNRCVNKQKTQLHTRRVGASPAPQASLTGSEEKF